MLIMPKPHKTAWLIGLYTNDLEYRVRRLGYKLTNFYPDLNFTKRNDSPPSMIAFSEDQFNDPGAVHQLRKIYPKTIMIRLPVYFPSDNPSYHEPLKANAYGAILRLLTSIQEMETRWEN